jgi:hypothetical protein
MEMHPYFTEIPLRSFEAMAFDGKLSEILLALIVDPHEANDVSRAILDIYPTRIDLVSNEDGRSIVDAPVRIEDFMDLGLKSFDAMKITVAQWVMTTDGASDALRVLTVWDRRFGVWCACAVAREALHYVLAEDQRPLRAIEAAEAWAIGKATIETVTTADAAARSAANYAKAALGASVYNIAAADAAAQAAAIADAAVAAAAAAADPAYEAADVAKKAARVASIAARRDADRREDFENWNTAFYAELFRLREVIANACLSFPG